MRRGNVDAEFAKGGKMVEASYYTPMLAHAPMEPPAAVAEFKNGKVEIWAATQNPQAVQDTVAKALGISNDDVLCHVTLLGGGFGRKSKPDYVAEAALLSKQVGKPVKIVWSREDDIQFDYFHSPAGMYLKAAVGERGLPTAWLQRSAFPPIASQNNLAEQYGGFQLGMGWTDIPYPMPNLRSRTVPRRRTSASGGCGRSRISTTRSRSSLLPTSWRRRPAGPRGVPARHHRTAARDRFRQRGLEADAPRRIRSSRSTRAGCVT